MGTHPRSSSVENFRNNLGQIPIPVVVAEFAFLQVQNELVRSAAVGLRKPPFCEAPEILYPVDVALPIHYLPSLSATAIAVPPPTKGSKKTSPSFDEVFIIRSSNASGFYVM